MVKASHDTCNDVIPTITQYTSSELKKLAHMKLSLATYVVASPRATTAQASADG
jgi:hypothetical protein